MVARRIAGKLSLGLLLGLGLVSAPVHGAGAIAAQQAEENAAGGIDEVTFRDGKVVRGEILEETETQIRMKVVQFGIEAVTTFEKRDVLSVSRNVGGGGAAEAAAPAPSGRTSASARTSERRTNEDAANRVYVVKLEGKFGEEITQTPIREAVRDAQRNGATHIVFELSNDWSANELEDLPDDAAAFDQLFRAEEIHPIFTEEIPRQWDPDPEVVFWVRRAMGGAAFLPLVCKNIYFHPEGKMGGVGNLGDLFGSTGSERVREKQKSLRMGHAEGAALHGGYPVEIVRAMADRRYVYSYRMEGGRPIFIEEFPDPSKGEILLTDHGEDEFEDTIEQLARSQGNDTLTLDAELAQKLGVSKGTVQTLDDLIFAMGLSRSSQIIDGSSQRIMQSWADGLVTARRQLRKLWQEYNEIQVGGDYNERTRARGAQKRKLREMLGILRKYEESLNPGQLRIPDEAQILQLIKQIELQQLADRK